MIRIFWSFLIIYYGKLCNKLKSKTRLVFTSLIAKSATFDAQFVHFEKEN